MTWCVYMLCRLDDSPFYVGKGRKDRPYHHIWEARSRTLRNRRKCQAIKNILKQGAEPIVKIVKEFAVEDEAFSFEVALIKKLGRYPHGPLLNLTAGGEGSSGALVTATTRAKLSRIRKNRPNSPAHCANISKGLRKSIKFKEYKARPISEELRRKFASIRRGRKHTPATKAKIAAANSRRTLSVKTRHKLADAVRRYYAQRRLLNDAA